MKNLIEQYRMVKDKPQSHRQRRDIESLMMFEFSQAINQHKKNLLLSRTNELGKVSK